MNDELTERVAEWSPALSNFAEWHLIRDLQADRERMQARIAELERERDEDQGVIAVWRGRATRAEDRIAELETHASDFAIDNSLPSRQAFEQECDDVDNLLSLLGLRPDDHRSEGGRLLVREIANALKDAEAERAPNAKEMQAAFWRKHAFGSLAAPSCFTCGSSWVSWDGCTPSR